MTTIEERLLRDLPMIAGTIETHPRPWKSPSRVRRRRRLAVVSGLAVLAVGGGGIALAGLLIPDKLDFAHDTVDDYGGCGIVEREQTRLVATAELDDGSRLELWIAPTTSGGVANSLLRVDANGASLGYSGGCQHDIDASWVSTSIDIVNRESIGTIAVYGHIAQDVPSVVATFESGATVTIEVQIDGYFVTSFRGEPAKYDYLPTIEPAP